MERLNLRNHGSKFEMLDIQIPSNFSPSVNEYGIFVNSDYECIIFGGFSVQEGKSVDACFKFTSCQNAPETFTQLTSESENPQNQKLIKGDFFSTQDVL